MDNFTKLSPAILICTLALLGCQSTEDSPKVDQVSQPEFETKQVDVKQEEEQKVEQFNLTLSPDGTTVDLKEVRDPANPMDAKKKPFGIEGFYKVKSMGSPVFSPDGQTILFTVTSHILKEGKSETDIYKVGFDGRSLFQMTKAKGRDADPFWSQDGESFYFVSRRTDSAQIWKMPMLGGTAEQVTDISTGTEHPVLSPDGKKIAFISKVFPEYGADDQKNKALNEDIEKSPIKVHVADHLLYRHWDSWADGRRFHILVLDIASGAITDVTPGDFDSPTLSHGGEFAFSPDSKEICFSSNREDKDAQSWTTNTDLWLVPVSGGRPRNITEMNKAFDNTPVYSPDGRFIAFKKQVIPGYESGRTRIAIYDRKDESTRMLTEEFDYNVRHFEWSEDSKKIVFSAQKNARYPLFEITLETGEISELKHIPSTRSFTTYGGGKLAFTFDRIGQPIELYAGYTMREEIARLTRTNVDLSKEYDIRPAEEVWFDAPNGRKIHTWIVKPHGYEEGRKYPLVLNIHGGPQGQWSDSLRGDWQVYSAAGYVTAFPNPTGSTGFGQEFTAAISKDWGGKVFEDVMAVTDGLAALDYVDEDKMGVMGWSYGGYMVNWILGQTDRFKAAASMMGIFDTVTFHLTTEELWFPEWDLGGTPWENPEGYAKWNPALHARYMVTPTLIVTGEKDFRIPYTQSLMLFTALRRRDIPARLVVFPNDCHWPSHVKSMPLYYAAHVDWFHQYLGGDPSPFDIQEMSRGRAFKDETN